MTRTRLVVGHDCGRPARPLSRKGSCIHGHKHWHKNGLARVAENGRGAVQMIKNFIIKHGRQSKGIYASVREIWLTRFSPDFYAIGPSNSNHLNGYTLLGQGLTNSTENSGIFLSSSLVSGQMKPSDLLFPCFNKIIIMIQWALGCK